MPYRNLLRTGGLLSTILQKKNAISFDFTKKKKTQYRLAVF